MPIAVPSSALAELDVYLAAWERSGCDSLVPLLPVMFTLKGKPYDVTKGHFPMRAMFEFGPGIPRKSLWQCARQTSKSTTQAHQGIALSATIPHFNTLFVTPLYEQVRRFSTNYVKPAINNSMLAGYLKEHGVKGQENVLQRTMPHNGSSMFFSFAYLDAERTRGLNNDRTVYDEVQGIDRTFIPIIREAMSASPWRLEQFAGTPMSSANTMAYLWNDSSQADWVVKCTACGRTNVMGHHGGSGDLLKCLGRHGLVCAKCDKDINTETGYWLHARPERRTSFTGRHAPQSIFPMHCRDPVRWQELLTKRDANFPTFMMECMAESWDTGTKLVNIGDLKKACVLPWKNTWEDYIKNYNTRGYQMRLLAVDWSGGGSDQVSLTAMAAIGIRIDGKVEVGWMKHYPHTTNWMEDAARVMSAFNQGAFHYLVSDHGGAGEGREQILLQAGFPMAKLFPVTYVHASGDKALMTYNQPAASNVRRSCSLDKARSLILSCELVKQGWVQYPEYASCSENLEDYLALVEETIQSPRGSDIHLIGKAQGIPDDMAHAVNIGTCSAFYLLQKWPDLGRIIKSYDKMVLGELNPDKGAARDYRTNDE